MPLNVITVTFGPGRKVARTKKRTRGDYGQYLEIKGLDGILPSVFEVHFSNTKENAGTAKTQIGQDGRVQIPYEYLNTGLTVYGWIFLHEGENDGTSEYIVIIDNNSKPTVVDVEPTPDEESTIGQLIGAINTALEQCEAHVEHYPTVIDGYWYVWDEATEQFVTTGVPATGNGIASARLNSDYTLTLVFTDGNSFTTPISIRGAQGEKGDTGAVPDFRIGTVTTLPAGSSASASITGTQEEPVLNLSIPQGQDGAITNLDTTLTVAGKAADAKATGDAVNDLKVDLDDIANTNPFDMLYRVPWEIGTIASLTGQTSASNTRIRTKDFINISQNSILSVSVDTGYKFVIVWYDISKTYIASTPFTVGSGTFNTPVEGAYVKVLLATVSNSTLTDTNISAHISAKCYYASLRDNDNEKRLLDGFTLVEPVNLLNFSDPDFLEGYYLGLNGVPSASASYNVTGFIDVEEGETYSYTYGSVVGAPQYMRFVTAYDAKGVAIETSSRANVTSYTVPTGVKKIRMSADASYLKPSSTTAMLYKGTTISEYSAYFEPYYRLKDQGIDTDYIKSIIDAKLSNVVTEYGTGTKAEVANMYTGDVLTVVQNIDNKKNAVIEFIGYFDSFTSVSLGHGFNMAYGSYAVIDDTYITVYYGSAPQEMAKEAHGLTITDFIHCQIKQNSSARAEIHIITATGKYTLDDCSWQGCRGDVFAKAGGTFKDCVCVAVFKDFQTSLYLFGDSYVSLGDATRFPYYLIKGGYTKLLIDGFGGRTSSEALVSFNNIINKAIPKIVVWGLGMNDEDTSTSVNASWLACVESILSTCSEHDIIPILATIPNCPNQRNTFKNAWVKASGYRYVDFAKAVGAESEGSSWYVGMLSSDNVHPTSLGAMALYARFLIDVPEVIK